MGTVRFGDDTVEEQVRAWSPSQGLPYRTTYAMRPGDHWQDMPASDRFHEVYVDLDGLAVPAGAVLCREFLGAGADWAFFTEQFAGAFVLVAADLTAVALDGPHGEIIELLREGNGGGYGGFPDVIASFPDGRIVLCELKSKLTKDRLQPNQHRFARVARALLGDRLELAVVRWG